MGDIGMRTTRQALATNTKSMSPSSVYRYCAQLKALGFIEYENGTCVFLTAEGIRLLKSQGELKYELR